MTARERGRAALAKGWRDHGVDLAGVGGLVILVVVLAVFGGLAYRVSRTRGAPPPARRAEERDTRDVQRDIPPNPG